MNTFQTWGEAISSSLLELWFRFINFFPTLVGALLVFFVGLAIARFVGKIVEKIVKGAKLDDTTNKLSIRKFFKNIGLDHDLSKILGEVVRWFLILVFLMAATDILGLGQISVFLNSIIMYIPKLVVAIVILAIGIVLGNLVYGVVRGSVKVAGFVSANFLAGLSKWAIIIFALLISLVQLGIAVSIVNNIITGIIASFALAVGLAFGLGGKEEAALILRKARHKLEENKE